MNFRKREDKMFEFHFPCPGAEKPSGNLLFVLENVRIPLASGYVLSSHIEGRGFDLDEAKQGRNGVELSGS